MVAGDPESLGPAAVVADCHGRSFLSSVAVPRSLNRFHGEVTFRPHGVVPPAVVLKHPTNHLLARSVAVDVGRVQEVDTRVDGAVHVCSLGRNVQRGFSAESLPGRPSGRERIPAARVVSLEGDYPLPARDEGMLGAAFRGAGPTIRATLTGLRHLMYGPVPSARLPYLQGVSATSAVVAWVAEKPGEARVEYGVTQDLGQHKVSTGGRRHAVTLSGLTPGSIYHYRTVGPDGVSATGSFRTAPEAGDGRSFGFAVIGDSGDGSRSQMAVAGLLEKLNPDFILHTGDVVYPSGKERHYERRFFAPYRKTIKSVPVFPVLGNHDVATRNGAAYLENFHPPKGGSSNTSRYYSFEWGSVHFTALDSELYHDDASGTPEQQKAWLERDLAAAARGGSRKVVFLHRPLYSSSRHGGDRTIRRDLAPLFIRYGVDLVFSGHDHCYERTLPMEGVSYVVSGGGGKKLYPAGESVWTARSISAHHVVVVRVEDGCLSLEAIKPGGTTLDRATLAWRDGTDRYPWVW